MKAGFTGPRRRPRPCSGRHVAAQGVRGLTKWVAQKHGDAVVDATGCRFDHVAIDLPHLLHEAARHARSEAHFAALLFRLLDGALSAGRPRRSVCVFSDGPAPLAKLLTQRARREASRGEGVDVRGVRGAVDIELTVTVPTSPTTLPSPPLPSPGQRPRWGRRTPPSHAWGGGLRL